MWIFHFYIYICVKGKHKSHNITLTACCTVWYLLQNLSGQELSTIQMSSDLWRIWLTIYLWWLKWMCAICSTIKIQWLTCCFLTSSHLPCASCPSVFPGPSWWSVCKPLSFDTSPTPACSAPYLAPPHPSIAAETRKKGERCWKGAVKKEENEIWWNRMKEDCGWDEQE